MYLITLHMTGPLMVMVALAIQSFTCIFSEGNGDGGEGAVMTA